MAEETKNPLAPTDEIATLEKDIEIFSGWIKRLENPDPVLRSEAAGKGIKLYDEVDRDAHAGSVLQQRIMAVVGKEWQILPAKSARKAGRPASTTQEQTIAEFVSNVLSTCNFDQARQELLKAILYGHYEAEIIWQAEKDSNVQNSSLRIKKIIGKHPRRFIFTAERELRLLTRNNMIEGESIPDRKFLSFGYGDSDNPYGCGLGRRLWWPVWFKKHGIKFWMIFLEKFGMPTVVGKYPSGTLPKKQEELMAAINAIQTDTGVKIPETMDIDLLEATRAGTVTHEQLCEYMDRQISKAVLGQTASTDGTPGKLGNDQNQSDVRQEIVEADADLLDSYTNETLIRWIVDFNFPNVTAYPTIKTFANAKPDLTARVSVDKTLVVDIGLPVGKSYFYETYGIPEPAPGEDLVEVRQLSAWPSDSSGVIPAKAGIQQGKEFAEGDSTDVADYLAAELAAASMPNTDAMMVRLKKLTGSAKSLEDLRDGIIDIFSDMNPADLGNTIARAMMLAEMSGRYEVADETGILQEKKSPKFAEGIAPSLMAVFKLPFKEQEKFFQNKLNIPTEKWTDLWKDLHAKGFMVAGAYKAELLTDFRGVVDKAITQGTTLADFRKDFDRIVSQHGWSYNGSRNWRSEVIYSTNIRTAYAAGRWEQLQDPDIIKAYPYLEYRHGDSKKPRPQHLAWNGLVLLRDDDFWKTHYPPNGWGCKCKVIAATKRDQKKAAENGKTEAPPEKIDKKTGEPAGIDKGWGYNVGAAAEENGYRVLVDKFETLPNDIARKWMASYVNEPAFERFISGEIKGEFPVAVMDEQTQEAISAQAQTIWLSDETLTEHLKRHPEIGLDQYRLLPEIINDGEVYKQGDVKLIYLWRDGKLYRAGVKRTRDKSGNYILTLFETTDKTALKNVRGKYERIR